MSDAQRLTTRGPWLKLPGGTVLNMAQVAYVIRGTQPTAYVFWSGGIQIDGYDGLASSEFNAPADAQAILDWLDAETQP